MKEYDMSTEIDSAMDLKIRDISPEDFKKFEGYVTEIFTAMGMDTTTPSTLDTPKRFLDALYEATDGYDGDPKSVTAFETECDSPGLCEQSQIIQGPIPFYALCEHHVLPFYGKVYVGYVAGEEIIGLSKLTRLVRVASRRFAVQERIGKQIAEMLMATIKPQGVGVYIEARHMCMEMRGVRESNALTRTTAWVGSLADRADLRREFFTSIGMNNHG